MATTTVLELSQIVRDMELQPRAKTDHNRITQYAEDMLAGIEFPPVVVYHDGETYWLSEGFHRCTAADHADLESIAAEIREGSREDAMLNSLGSNKEWDSIAVGMKRTNADKQRALDLMLDHCNGWSSQKIADWIGVSREWVSKTRKARKEKEQRIKELNVNSSHAEDLCVPEPSSNGHTKQEDQEDEQEAEEASPPVEIAEEVELFVLNGESETKPTTRSTFNQTNEMVDWAKWTWNPVTGCEHTCFYCYARDIANRFYPEKFTPTNHPERLEAPRNTSIPRIAEMADDPVQRTAWRNVFVCSMADLFGRWVPDEWIEGVFESCRQSPEWNYLFLTKFPQRYMNLDFPETSWVGTSVDEQKRVVNAEKAFRKIEVPVKWLSVEPMLEPLRFSDLRMFDWVVIGGQSRSTGSSETFPDPRWVHDLTDQAIKAGCKVYWKENIAPKVGMFKEYPDAFVG